MAKATLEYDLSDPDDRREFERASRATDLAVAIWEIREVLARERNSERPIKDPDKLVEVLLKECARVLDERGVDDLV